MKIKIDWGYALLALSLACILALAGFLTFKAFQPLPVQWVTTETPVATDTKLSVQAVTRRDYGESCSNAPQMELLADGAITRLPVPTRLLKGDNAVYTTELLAPFAPGRYKVRVVEVTNCGSPKLSPSPWLAFEVAENG